MTLRKKILATVAAIALSSSLSSAAISISGSSNGTFTDVNTDPFSYTVLNTGSALVIGFYVDDPDPATSISFGGVAADNYFNNGRTWLAYWDNPATGEGTLVVEGISGFGGPDLMVGAYELDNVDLTATVTSSTGNSITTPTDGEFVISFTGVNGNGSRTPTATSIIDTDTFTLSSVEGGGSVGGGAGLAGDAGTQNVSWSSGDVVSYSFQPVPEPSAFALFAGCLGLSWVMIRRRS